MRINLDNHKCNCTEHYHILCCKICSTKTLSTNNRLKRARAMIKSIVFENFYSFRESTAVSFEVNKKPKHTLYDTTDIDGNRVNKVAAILGANGSGKTTLLKPLSFLAWFLSISMQGSKENQPIPYSTYALDTDKDTVLEVFFELNLKNYHYKLTLNSGFVKTEELRVKTSRLYSFVFVRQMQDDSYSFKQKRFGFREKIASSIRNNVSIISAADQFDVPTAKIISDYFSTIYSNIHNSFGRHRFTPDKIFDAAEFFYGTGRFTDLMSKTMASLDLGLENVELKKEVYKTKEGEEETLFIPYGIHRVDNQEFSLPFFHESSGTQSAFVLLSNILPVLEAGSIAVIDELDSDLHPHIIPVILDWFTNDDVNPKNAQLIFSCHMLDILNHLQKHQIFLTEKKNCQSEAWRLDEVEHLRADDNLYNKYYSGSLGGVPDLI